MAAPDTRRPTAARDAPGGGDRALLERLKGLIAHADPVPPRVIAEGRASLAWKSTLADLRALERAGTGTGRPTSPLGRQR